MSRPKQPKCERELCKRPRKAGYRFCAWCISEHSPAGNNLSSGYSVLFHREGGARRRFGNARS